MQHVTRHPDRSGALAHRAATLIRRSKQHLVASVLLCGGILGWYALRGVDVSSFVAVVAIGAFLVGYNVVRIRRARAALAEPARLRAFADGQRRSHRVRGRIYLIGAPVLVAATWTATLVSAPRLPVDAWAVLAATTALLGVGWVSWLRAVRALPRA